MPYVDLYSEDDYASIYYSTNTACNNVSAFDPEKPTVVILHPTLLDSTWLDQQMGDHRLYSNYNIIVFDMRTCGRSLCRPNARHDSWVEAADLAFCFQKLCLPSAHFFALEALSIHCALRFAVLFPEFCLSLTLCNVPSPTESEWMLATYGELLQMWCNAEDLDTFEHVMKECVTLLTGGRLDLDLQDELIAYWQMNMPPSRKVRIAETFGVLMHRTPLDKKAFMKIKQPTLILHGEKNMTSQLEWAERLQAKLVNARGGAVVYTVKGAPSCLSINPLYSSIANGTFYKFLSRQPHARSDLRPQSNILDRMHEALDDLSDLMDDSNIGMRDPGSSLSFCCMPERMVKAQKETLLKLRQSAGKEQEFSPLGPDGRPLRKYSEKIAAHWFHGLSDGLSIADNKCLLPPSDPARVERSSSKEKLAVIKEVPTEKPEKELVRSAARRGTFNAGSNIQQSMAKVVSNVQQSTFALIL